MDALDRLGAPAADLLARVDAALAHAGAPDDHPVWPLLRRLKALPGEAVGAFTAVSPAALAAAGSALRQICAQYAQASATVPAGATWRGAGADSFAVQWSALRTHLGEDLTDRLWATVSYVDAVRDWTLDTRDALARTLVVILTSAEAVLIRTAGTAAPREWPASLAVSGDAARAAADIAARVLETLVEAYDRGEALLGEWGPRLDEVAYHAPAAGAPAGLEPTTEVFLTPN